MSESYKMKAIQECLLMKVTGIPQVLYNCISMMTIANTVPCIGIGPAQFCSHLSCRNLSHFIFELFQVRHETFDQEFNKDLEEYKRKGQVTAVAAAGEPSTTLETFVPDKDPELDEFLEEGWFISLLYTRK